MPNPNTHRKRVTVKLGAADLARARRIAERIGAVVPSGPARGTPDASAAIRHALEVADAAAADRG
jgi:hypothetical protein